MSAETPGRSRFRIATYNAWNAPISQASRMEAIARHLVEIDADAVAMQEVPVEVAGEPVERFLARATDYPTILFRPEGAEPDPGELPEGLVMLSRHPVRDLLVSWDQTQPTANNWAMRGIVDWRGYAISVINVHLDWEKQSGRRHHLTETLSRFAADRSCAMEIVCGDFNDEDDLFDADHPALQGWRDVAAEHARSRGRTPPPTIDFLEGNPRPDAARGDPRRFDRVYVRASPGRSQPLVLEAGLLADAAEPGQPLPSDHRGVFADLLL